MEKRRAIKGKLNITGKDAEELANCGSDEEIREWLKAYIRKKYKLPSDTEIDLNDIHISATEGS